MPNMWIPPLSRDGVTHCRLLGIPTIFKGDSSWLVSSTYNVVQKDNVGLSLHACDCEMSACFNKSCIFLSSSLPSMLVQNVAPHDTRRICWRGTSAGVIWILLPAVLSLPPPTVSLAGFCSVLPKLLLTQLDRFKSAPLIAYPAMFVWGFEQLSIPPVQLP